MMPPGRSARACFPVGNQTRFATPRPTTRFAVALEKPCAVFVCAFLCQFAGGHSWWPALVPLCLPSCLPKRNSFFARGPLGRDGIRIVDIQHDDRRSADGCLANKDGALPAKMMGPQMTSRMIESDDLLSLGINSSEIGAFMKVARMARERQVSRVIAAPMLFGNDMLSVICGEGGPLLWKVTIFTTIFRPCTDEVTCCGIHQALSPLRTRRAFDCSTVRKWMARTYVSYSSFSAAVSRPSFAFSART